MSLTALPVSATDLTTLQAGVQFFTNTGQATSQAAAINATGSTQSVFTYAASLINSNISLSQVAMAVSAIAESGTIAVGDTATPNTLTFLSTQFLPGQVAFAAANGFNQTVFAAQALGLALAGTSGFQTDWAGLSGSQFVTSVASATGLNASAIQGFLTNWIAFYTANGVPGGGLTVIQAAYGATLGDSIGVALLNPTSANLQSVFSTTTANNFSPNTGSGLVQNALIDVATGQYTTGVSLSALPTHTALQGQLGNGGVFLTQNIDTPNSGFAANASGTPLLNGFTATTAGTVFTALPFVTALGLANNTLNTGDDLETSGAATGTAVLNYTTADLFAANPAFATGVTMNGVATANITNTTTAGFEAIAGFQGTITGLTTVSSVNSLFGVQVGAAGQGIDATGPVLGAVNIENYAGPTDGVYVMNAIIAAAAGSAANTIDVGITGALGSTAAFSAGEIRIANDGATGTAASPNLSYGTWDITWNANAFLELGQDGVGDATALTLAGGAVSALGQFTQGDWQLLQSIDETATTGTMVITGATAGNDTNFLASAANPGWLFGSNFGLLDDTGTGGVFDLTSVLLGSGLDVLDVSSATAAQVQALTTGPGTGVTVNPGDIIIVQDSVATTTSTATFANIAGFSTLGIGGGTAAQGAAGTINMANMPGSINTLLYMTQAAGSVTVNNGVSNLTVNVNHNTEAGVITTLGINDASTTSTTDTVTLILGDTVGTVGGIAAGLIDFDGVGPFFGGAINGLETTGYANVDIDSNGPSTGVNANVLSGNAEANVFTANPGALETLTIAGSTELINNAIFVNGVGGTGVITDNDTAATQIFAFGNNAPLGAGAGGPTNVATNAEVINGAASGGLWMGGSDSFFNGATSVGDVITGSATASNVLAGSVGNDTITGGSGTDLIITDNGGDIINLGAGHTADTIDLFFGNFAANGGGFNGTAAGTFTDVVGLANSIIAANDVAVAGSWGVGAAVTAAGTPAAGTLTPFQLFAHSTALNNGTSADMSVVGGFDTGATGDVLNFSVGAWSRVGLGNGLMSGNLTFAAANFVNPGNDANIITVPAGGSVPHAATVVEITGITFVNANALALALGDNTGSGGGTYNLVFAGAPGALNSHILVAYETPGGAADIADVDVTGASTSSTHDHVVASDMVQLTGVNVANLANHNIHFVV